MKRTRQRITIVTVNPLSFAVLLNAPVYFNIIHYKLDFAFLTFLIFFFS